MKSKLKTVGVFIASLAIICGGFAFYANNRSTNENNVYAEEETENIAPALSSPKVLSLKIDDPIMKVNGTDTEIGPGNGTTPVIVSGRTLVPIRAIIENMGGTVEWNSEARESVLTYGEDVIRLTIDSQTAYLNDTESTLDTAPTIINGRTMLPIRFIGEGFGFNVDWNEEEKTITISEKAAVQNDSQENTENTETPETAPVVYMTKDITPEALVEIYDKLNFNAKGNVAVKMSTGEPPASNYLRPELIGDLVKKVDGTIVECNTAYGGSRASAAAHWQVIKDHGLDNITEKGADIMDEESDMEIPAQRGTTIHEDYVGSHLANYDCLISLAHFKGHAMAGYGGAIKNMSIGVASSKGKAWIHSGGTSTTDAWGGKQDKFLEAMGDATSGVVDYFNNKGGQVVYINVMNRLSVDCDCDGNPAEPDMHDIGILASTDPVALDQACLDLIYEQKDGDGASLVERIESRNGLHTLEHAEEIGLGSREYQLVSID